MDTATMKLRLHNYLEQADDKHLEAIYTILEKDLEAIAQYDEATLSILYQRRDNHLQGISKSYSVDQAISFVREKSSKK